MQKYNKKVVANWKMNGSFDKIIQDFNRYLNDERTNSNNIVYALPYPYLQYTKKLFIENKSLCSLASQDISQFSNSGAYTGEISGEMLRDCGALYSIIGHSERRNLLNETNSVLVDKIASALKVEMIPIYCIGENINLRRSGEYLIFIQQQLEVLLDPKIVAPSLIVAYEPIWAIGTGVNPSHYEIEETTKFIKKYLSEKLPNLSKYVLYGGSVNGGNAVEVLGIDSVDGVLVGGAALNPAEFTKICDIK